MYRLYNNYILKMIEQHTTSAEIDVILYIAQFQDNYGVVHSVYYKNVCEKLKIAPQTFYNCLESLKEKGLITYTKKRTSNRLCKDLEVTLTDNEMPEDNYVKEGYLKVTGKKFDSDKFRTMKAGSKLLYLYLQRYTKGKHMLVVNFYEEFCRLFGVVRKSMQEYIHELKKNFLLFISKKRNKANNYEMTMKNSPLLDNKDVPNEKDHYLNNIMNLIARNFSKVLPAPEKMRKELSDIASLLMQQRAISVANNVQMLLEAVESCINTQHDEMAKDIRIKAAMVNNSFTRALSA